MNARSYRISLNLTPVDFPAIIELGQSTVAYQSEPHILDKMLVLNITKVFILSSDVGVHSFSKSPHPKPHTPMHGVFTCIPTIIN